MVPMRRSFWVRLARKSRFWRGGLPRFPHPLHIQLAPVAQWFHAASDTTRLDILELLSQRERCQSEIARLTGAPQSNVSFHLRVLKEAGLITEHRDGRRRFYGLRGETLDNMVAVIQFVSPGKHRGTCLLSGCQ
jgi:ArsR family transcriptional regulator